jgi:dihydrolipoamide dehydrogenase
MTERVQADLVVLGAGPGGYTAAFRAADLGKSVALVERHSALGGVCLNVGCIPSKTLLHMAEVIDSASELRDAGIDFGEPRFDLEAIRARKNAVVKTLTRGLSGLARQRGVRVLTGEGSFESPHRISVQGSEGAKEVSFESAIIAAGSRATGLPGLPDRDPRVMDSTAALEIEEVPERLLVIGGGIIGLEMATVYAALGSEITVVELLGSLMAEADPDLVRPLEERIRKRYAGIFLETRVTGVEARADGLRVSLAGSDAPASGVFDRVLVAVGRTPNGGRIGAERAGVEVDEHGFIPVDEKRRTNVPHIFAVGDVTGPPLLAHKAVHEGKVAAEVIAGLSACYDPGAVPSVAYTDPEIAWMGLSESEAEAKGIAVEKAIFPWAASGRALALGRKEGLTKLLFDSGSGRLLGAGIVGPNAGELIGEAVLALEMGADAEDIALTVHAHPTLSETLGFAAEIAAGTITDLYLPKKRK